MLQGVRKTRECVEPVPLTGRSGAACTRAGGWRRGRSSTSRSWATRRSLPRVDAGNWIALASAIAAIGGAAVAVWQGVAARRAAATAKDQAARAERVANTAEAQAQEAQWQAIAAEQHVTEALRTAAAADKQVQLMRRQFDAAEVERYEHEGPDFHCRAEGRSGSTCSIVVTMASGPGELAVRVAERWVVPRAFRGLGDIRVGGPVENLEYRVVPQGSFTVHVDLDGYEDRVIVGLRLECTELGGRGRSWTRHRSVPVDAVPPRPRVY
jgi:hypothetical protein